MQVMEDAELAGDHSACVVILCAEDAIRAAIAYWTASLPLRTIVASDGYQANRILRNGDCRLLVTDRVLPPWPGLDTFRQMRERNTDLRIAFVEGIPREDVGLARAPGPRSDERRVGEEGDRTSCALVTGVQTCALPI